MVIVFAAASIDWTTPVADAVFGEAIGAGADGAVLTGAGAVAAGVSFAWLQAASANVEAIRIGINRFMVFSLAG
jgi:hypothetical protein